jgi:sugar lactone lactonase YvrE
VLSLTARAQIYYPAVFAGTYGSSGSADGTGSAARFHNAAGVAVDRSGNVYVADAGNHTIRKITSSGVVTTLAGTAGLSGSANGTGSAARFSGPLGVAVDRDGNVYVADTGNSTIRKITAGGVVTTLAGVLGGNGYQQGGKDGPGHTATFCKPWGLAVDGSGNIFVADRYNGQVRKVTADGFVSTLASALREPTSVAVDTSGNLYVTCNTQVTLIRITPAGAVETLAVVGPITAWFFNGVAVDGGGNCYVVGNDILMRTPDGVFTPLSYAVGAGTPFQFGANSGIAVRGDGTLFASTGNVVYSVVPLANPARLINVSVLATLAAGGDTVTLGTITGGAGTLGTQPLLVRAAGPSLAAFGVTGPLADPRFEVYAGETKAGENDDWGGSANLSALFAQVGAFPYSSPTSKDAALSAPAVVKGNFSVRVSGSGTAGGNVLAEVYEATPVAARTPTMPRLINVSALKNIGAGLAVGFVIDGIGQRAVLIRAVGPTLASFGLTGLLADPKLELFDGQSRSIGANDNWSGSPSTISLRNATAKVGTFPLSSNNESALLVTLTPGSYTVQVRSADATTGVALAEVYEVP